MFNKKGRFIVLEGQGFVGKSVQAQILVKELNSKKIKAVETFDIGGTKATESIRKEILERRARKNITTEEEIELFYKSRHIMLEGFTKPNLKKGLWIVSSRFSPSTFVYQGMEGGVNLDFIKKLDKKIVGDFKPDLYILIDLSPEEIIRRLTLDSNRIKHSFNELNGTLIRKRREYYLQLAREDEENNWVIVEGKGTPEKVQQKIWEAVSKKLKI